MLLAVDLQLRKRVIREAAPHEMLNAVEVVDWLGDDAVFYILIGVVLG